MKCLARRSVLVSMLAALTLLFPAAALALPAPLPPAWQMSGHDAAHTSRSAYAGPSAAVVRWRLLGAGSGTPVVGGDGAIYVGGIGGLFALAADGSTRFHVADLGAPALDNTGTTVYATDTSLHALDLAGAETWQLPGLAGVPLVAGDGTIFTTDGGIHAVSPSGTDGWHHTWPAGDIAVGSNGVSYVSDSNMLVAFNPDGTQKWQWWAGSATVALGQPVVDDHLGTVYVGARSGGRLYALDQAGHTKWSVPTAGTHIYGAPALAADGTVYVATYSNRLQAFNPNGSLKWSLPISPGRMDQGLAVDASGTIYAVLLDSLVGADYFPGSNYSDVVAVNPNGTVKWRYAVDGNNLSAPVIGTDNTVYVTGVHAYFTDSGAEATPTLWAIGPASGGISFWTISSPRVRTGQQTILAGSLTDTRTIGQVMDVQVQKPYKTHWSYSSNRRIYEGNRQFYPGGGQAVWQYKYTWVSGMTKGTYRFRANYGGMYSSTASVTLR